MTNEVLEKLEDLLAEDQFELINLEQSAASGEYRLVYLMNDAVESFLVFQNAKLTGDYQEGYEGPIGAILQETENGYALVIHQEENICTLFFEDLVLENHFYNYGEVGHCWVKGWENIRVMEFQIAIMRDKYDYLGERSCTDLERKLAMLRDFPPLNYSCYPAVPEKYLVERGDKWKLTKEAADVMREIAMEAEDDNFAEKLNKYEKQQQGLLSNALWQTRTRNFAKLFQLPEHRKILKVLHQKIKEATKDYPERIFLDSDIKLHNQLKEKAEKRAKELRMQGKEVMIYRQEPFIYDIDSIEYQVFLIIIDSKGNVEVEVMEI